MDELKFTIKVFIITLFIALIFQLKVGEKSAEFYAYSYLTNSWLSERVQEVTAGGVKLAKDGYKKVTGKFGSLDKENAEGKRTPIGKLRRSDAYLKAQGEEAGEE